MKLLNDILYLEFSEMIACGFSENYLRKAKATGTKCWDFINDPSDRRKVLIGYDKLRDEYKEKVKLKFGGDPYEYHAKTPIRELVEKDLKAERFYLSFRYDSDKSLPIEHVNKYVKAASWLNMLIKLNADKKYIKTVLKLSLVDFWTNVCAIVKTEKIELPATYQRLKAKCEEYAKDGYQCLISWRFGNQLAAKITDDVSSSVLLELIEHPNQYDDVIVCYMYNKWAIENNYKPIEPRTVCVWRNKKEAEIMIGRYGNAAFNEKYIRQVKGFRPSAPGLLWESDDYNTNYYYIDPNQPEGKNAHNRYVSYIVIDSHCGLVLGKSYRLAASPTMDMVHLAYIDAMYYVRSLTGAWYLPFEVKADHWSKASAFPFFKSIGNFVPPAVGNKHRGYIEPYFGSPHAKRCEKLGANNYNGNNVTARNKGVNEDFVKKNIKNRPLVGNEAETQIEAFIYKMRHFPDITSTDLNAPSKVQKWLSAWNELPEDRKREINDEQFLQIFGFRHEPGNREISITNRGVEPQISGVKYSYDLPDYTGMIHMIGAKVTVIYDPYDMSRVLVTNDKDIRFIARAATMQPRALADATTGSRTALNKILKDKKDQVDRVTGKKQNRQALSNGDQFDSEAVMFSGMMLKELRNEAELAYIEYTETNNSNNHQREYDPLEQM